MKRMPGIAAALVVLLGCASMHVVLISHAEAGIVAFRNYSGSASGAGQSDAFIAQADDPSAIFYNPAGITQLERLQVSFGSLFIGGHLNFRNAAGQTARGDFGGSAIFPPPSFFYLAANLDDLGPEVLRRGAIGLGVAPVFGTVGRFPKSGPFATAEVESILPLLTIKPTFAYRLTEDLSIAASADIHTFTSFLGQGQLEVKFISPGLPSIPAGSFVEINGTGTGAGLTVGLLYTPFKNADGKPRANVGLVYRSQATVPLEGNLLVNGVVQADTATTLVLPQSLTGGVALWPIRDRSREWKFELDVDWTDWQSQRTQDFQLSTGGTLSVPRNWDNSFVVMAGTEHRWLHPAFLPDWELAMRGGVMHSSTPIPDRTFNPAIPDADQNGLSIGAGFLCGGNGRFLGLFPCGGSEEGGLDLRAIALDLSYSVSFYESRTIAGNINPTVDGSYLTVVHQGAFTITLKL